MDDMDDLENLMEVGGGFSGLAQAKDDVILLKDEAIEIKKEIEEVQRLAKSLMQRQERVMEAIGRLRGIAGV